MPQQRRARQRARRQYIRPDQLARASLAANMRVGLILALLYETGCALQELPRLRIRDLTSGSGTRALRFGTGSRRRLVPISPSLAERLHTFLATHPTPNYAQAYLLYSRESPVLTTRRVEQLLAALGKRALGFSITPRMLRTTAIIHDFQSGMPVRAIEQKTGLKSIRNQLYKHCVLENMNRDQHASTRWSA